MTKKLTPNVRFKGFSDDWEQRKLGELVDIDSGWSPSNFETEKEGGIPFIKVDDLNQSIRVQVDARLKVKQDLRHTEIKKGSSIFPKRGAAIMTNKVRILGINAYMDTNMMALYPKYVDEQFLFEFLSKTGLFKIADTSTIPQINNKHIVPYPILLPNRIEQRMIGAMLKKLDTIIASNQKKVDQLKQLKKLFLQKIFSQEWRFKGFTDPWEQHKFNTLYKKVIEKNDLSFTSDQIISVANMYYKKENKSSDDAYMKTYNIFRIGDIAFEGNKSKNFSYGRFVENTIGDGIVSHVFDVFRPNAAIDLNYWKYAIHNENFMGKILRKVTTHSTMMTNLVSKDFLREAIPVPSVDEQTSIGNFLIMVDTLIASDQKKLDQLKQVKKWFLQNMFV